MVPRVLSFKHECTWYSSSARTAWLASTHTARAARFPGTSGSKGTSIPVEAGSGVRVPVALAASVVEFTATLGGLMLSACLPDAIRVRCFINELCRCLTVSMRASAQRCSRFPKLSCSTTRSVRKPKTGRQRKDLDEIVQQPPFGSGASCDSCRAMKAFKTVNTPVQKSPNFVVSNRPQFKGVHWCFCLSAGRLIRDFVFGSGPILSAAEAKPVLVDILHTWIVRNSIVEIELNMSCHDVNIQHVWRRFRTLNVFFLFEYDGLSPCILCLVDFCRVKDKVSATQACRNSQ